MADSFIGEGMQSKDHSNNMTVYISYESYNRAHKINNKVMLPVLNSYVNCIYWKQNYETMVTLN
jgi:hypothetical protein